MLLIIKLQLQSWLKCHFMGSADKLLLLLNVSFQQDC